MSEKGPELAFPFAELSGYNYQIFRDPEERTELYQHSKGLAKQIQERNIANIVLVDRSARPIYVGLQEYWRLNISTEKMPRIFFVNPAGFSSHEHMPLSRPDEFDEFFPDDPVNRCVEGSREDIRPEAEVIDEFKKTHSYLLDRRQESVLLFDICLHSGATIKPVVDTMKKLGFSNLIIGTVYQPNGNPEFVRPNFWITGRKLDNDCNNTFGQDDSIYKTYDSIISNADRSQNIRGVTADLRHEIKQLIQEEYELDQRS